MAFPATFFVRNFLPLIFKSARLKLEFYSHLISHKIVCFVVRCETNLLCFLLFCVCQNTNVVAIVLQTNYRFTDFSMLSCVYVRQNTNVIETMCFLLSFSLLFPSYVFVRPRRNCGVLQVKCPLTVFPVDFYFFCTP